MGEIEPYSALELPDGRCRCHHRLGELPSQRGLGRNRPTWPPGCLLGNRQSPPIQLLRFPICLRERALAN